MSQTPADSDHPLKTAAAGDDAAAVEALISAGFDARAAIRTCPQARERIERLSQLLGLLDCKTEADRALADVTFARMMQARGQKLGAPRREAKLSPADDEALESLVMSGFESSRVPSALRERARRHESLARLVTAPSAPSTPTLVDRTLARIQANIDVEAASLTVQPGQSRFSRGPGMRLSDLVSIAAVLLIGAGVVLPVLTAMREQSRRSVCRTNLGVTAQAMATYAGSNRDSLPVANASLGGGTWWDVKPRDSRSNSANLFTLTRQGFVPLEALACPGNPKAQTKCDQDACDWGCLDEVSYSYQIMFGPQKPAWCRSGNCTILADRSPIVPQSQTSQLIDPFANAPNHRGAGQHLLHNDGSLTWETSPVLKSGDNIWLPRSLEQMVNQLSPDRRRQAPALKGVEMPATDDTFLGP